MTTLANFAFALIFVSPLAHAAKAREVASRPELERSEIRLSATPEFRQKLKDGQACVENAALAYRTSTGHEMSEDAYTDLIDNCLSPVDSE